MSSIDDLFKGSSSASKRKLDISHDPSHFYKSTKLTSNGDAKGKTHATVNDEEEEDDTEAGPALPPDEAAGPEDDEDGRFFGAGVDRRELAALDYLDERDAEGTFKGEEKYDAAWVRRITVSFDKKVSKNSDLRARYPDEPGKFMSSEADLDDEIKKISILSQHPEQYEEYARLGGVNHLAGLLLHENVDIAIAALDVIGDLVDDGVEGTDAQIASLIKPLLDANLLSSIFANLSRLDETEQADIEGVSSCLKILESLASQPLGYGALAKDQSLLKWLLARTQRSEKSISGNKLVAAEVLSVLLQSSTASRTVLAELDAVDIMLQQLAPYRLKDPEEDALEEEFVGNLFDAVAYLVQEPSGKGKFLGAEGVELAILMIREGKASQIRALQLLDLAASGSTGAQICEKLIDFEGLRPVLKMVMKDKGSKALEHALDILAALLRNLPESSESRIRLVVRLQDDDDKSIKRIAKLRDQYAPRLKAVEETIMKERAELNSEDQAERELDWLTERLDAGFSILQTIDTILAWLAIEDEKSRKRIGKILKAHNSKLEDVRKSLKAQRKGIVDDNEEAEASKEMLAALITLLKG